MSEVFIVGVDLAKRVFQLHGSKADGSIVFRKKLSRAQFTKFLEQTPPCKIAMEACATAHHWGRFAIAQGHTVRLIPPNYVKPIVKRQKNDANDAEAIVEAALRPSMSFVPVKTEEQQAKSMLFRTRELFVRQRTQLINAFRGHLAEHGVALAQGPRSVLAFKADFEKYTTTLPTAVLKLAKRYLKQMDRLTLEIDAIEKEIRKVAAKDDEAKRLRTMPSVGPMTAMAIQAFCPDMANFESGRHFSAWLGLVPGQHSSGGKERLGRVTKMGQRDV